MPDDIARFVAAGEEARAQLGAVPGGHVTLVDMRGMHIQTQESVAGFARVLANPRNRARRVAFVVERGLSRMQIQRIATAPSARFFPTIAAAEAWLLKDHEAGTLRSDHRPAATN